MRALIERIQNEPVLVTGLIAAVLYGLTEFGVQVTDGQQAAILGVAGAILAFVARSKVTPVKPEPPLTEDDEVVY